jgi:hypothetical protein
MPTGLRPRIASGDSSLPGVGDALLEKRKGSGFSAGKKSEYCHNATINYEHGVLLRIREITPSNSTLLMGFPPRSSKNLVTISRFFAGEESSISSRRSAERFGGEVKVVDGWKCRSCEDSGRAA